ALDDGDEERGGLAGAGLGLAGDVTSRQRKRQRPGLDRRAAGESGGVQAGEKIRVQLEAVEEDVGERLLVSVHAMSVAGAGKAGAVLKRWVRALSGCLKCAGGW